MDFTNYLFPLIMIPFRYFFITAIFYYIFYVLYKNKYLTIKIQKKFPVSKMISNEIYYSIQTMIIFAIIAIFIRYLIISGFTLVYKNITDFGFAYLFF